jgi:Ca2+-binding RTX toxin-like protein
VCIGGDKPRRHTPHSTKKMTFKISSKIKAIYKDSKIDPRDLKPEMMWDPKNPPKPIWENFNMINRDENTNDRGEIIGEHTDDYIRGTGGNDTIYGQHGSDLIYGGDGNDRLSGDDSAFRATDGIDTIYGGRGKDYINAHVAYGEEGNDRLFAPHSGGAYLNGGDGDDRLNGALARDTLVGGAGDDYLRGGTESDTMTGGDGADHFVVGQMYEHRSGIGSDLITDFQDIGDKISFELVTYNNLSFEDLSFNFNSNGTLIVSSDIGELAQIQGLNPNVDLDAQIENTSNDSIQVVAEM